MAISPDGNCPFSVGYLAYRLAASSFAIVGRAAQRYHPGQWRNHAENTCRSAVLDFVDQ